MRLHRLTLRHVKGVRERTVELPEHGVVVVEGPNEIGKTTLLEAFDALLTYKASSRSAEVRGLKPVDADEGPFVEAEFTVGSTRVRYAKRWLRQPSTTLQVLGDRPEQLTGDLAQQRVDALLGRHLDRTLYDALRLTQAGDGTLAPLSSSNVLTAALDAAAGARLHTDGADALLEEVEKEYRRHFTATGRPTGDYRAAMNRHLEAQQDVAEAHRRVEEARDLLQRREAARDGAAQADEEERAARDELARAGAAVATVEEVEQANAAALEVLARARELHRTAVRAHEDRARTIAEERSLSRSIEAALAARASLEAEATRLQVALSEAETAAGLATDAVESASAAVDDARAEADRLADLRELDLAESLLVRAAELVDRVRAARESLPDRPVEREDARRVRGLQDRLDALVLQHEASTPTLEVESLGARVQVLVAGGRAAGDVPAGRQGDVPAGRQGEAGGALEGDHGLVVELGGFRSLGVADDTTVEVPGQVRVRILLHEEAQNRVAHIHEARRRLTEALAELGVGHVYEVDALADVAEAARTAVREAVRDVEALLRPLGSAVAAEAAAGALPAVLAERVDRARQRVDGHRVPQRGTPDERLDEQEARAAVDRAAQHLREAVAAQRRAAEVLATRRQETGALTRHLDQATGRREADQARLGSVRDRLSAAREETPDAALADAVVTAAARVGEAEAGAARSRAALAQADVPRVRAEHDEAGRRAAEAVRRREAAQAVLHTLGGQLAMAAGEGRQELYDQAVAGLDDAERELQVIDRRARASRHLRTTLRQHRDDAHRLYVRPYTEALEELGRRVYGAGFSVAVDEQLTLTSRTLDGVTVPYADLSGGAKEQLGILARLAVARLVDPAHGCPVVIDDALGYTDPQRLRQMGEVLGNAAGAGDDVQVILLTCTPDRYAAIPDARTVRLTA